LSTTNPTWPDLGSNPGRRGGKQATKRLSYVRTNFYIYNIWNLSRKHFINLLHFTNSISFHYVLFKTKMCILSESMHRCCRTFYQIYQFSQLLVRQRLQPTCAKALSISWLRGYWT
jgi:hypothetical protein